jgi:hypothetical protein
VSIGYEVILPPISYIQEKLRVKQSWAQPKTMRVMNLDVQFANLQACTSPVAALAKPCSRPGLDSLCSSAPHGAAKVAAVKISMSTQGTLAFFLGGQPFQVGIEISKQNQLLCGFQQMSIQTSGAFLFGLRKEHWKMCDGQAADSPTNPWISCRDPRR